MPGFNTCDYVVLLQQSGRGQVLYIALKELESVRILFGVFKSIDCVANLAGASIDTRAVLKLKVVNKEAESTSTTAGKIEYLLSTERFKTSSTQDYPVIHLQLEEVFILPLTQSCFNLCLK